MDVTGASIDDYTGRAVFQRRGEMRGRDPPVFLSFYFSISFVFVTVLAPCRLFRLFFLDFFPPFGTWKGFPRKKKKRRGNDVH